MFLLIETINEKWMLFSRGYLLMVVCKAHRRLCTLIVLIIKAGFLGKLFQEAPVSFIFSHFPFSFFTRKTTYEDDFSED